MPLRIMFVNNNAGFKAVEQQHWVAAGNGTLQRLVIAQPQVALEPNDGERLLILHLLALHSLVLYRPVGGINPLRLRSYITLPTFDKFALWIVLLGLLGEVKTPMATRVSTHPSEILPVAPV